MVMAINVNVTIPSVPVKVLHGKRFNCNLDFFLYALRGFEMMTVWICFCDMAVEAGKKLHCES